MVRAYIYDVHISLTYSLSKPNSYLLVKKQIRE